MNFSLSHWRSSAILRLCFSLCVFTVCVPSLAQQTIDTASTPQRLGEITVTGNPLGSAAPVAPASSLRGTPLLLRSKSTLGETLDGLPGVSSSYFGPNASRPVIRGLDGDRIRILSNGGGSLDLSGLSQDHAVGMDPLTAERIEVLRGPGALLYGGSAVGGVVNVIDNRIAREPQFDAKGGVSGKAELSAATGNRERTTGLLLEAGNDRYQVHADTFYRQSGDVSVPRRLPCEKNGLILSRQRICNSANQADGGAVGVSWFGTNAFLGLSASTYRSNYGVVAEDDVTIGMLSNRYVLEGELRNVSAWLQTLSWSLGHSDYAHTERSPTEATRFANRGSDLRLQVKHAPWEGWAGVFGMQLDGAQFKAVGKEVFAPPSETGQAAVFLFEERGTNWGKLTAGARLESVQIESLGGGERFVQGRRNFAPKSWALGAQRMMAGGWQLSSNLSFTERAPRDYELFANGPHVATAAYEQGDANLSKEQSSQVDVGAQWRSGEHRFAANVYLNRFSNYISLVPMGGFQDGLAEFKYKQVPALFRGLELSGQRRLIDGSGTLDLGLKADSVHAENRLTGEPLPRIAPWRVGASLNWAQAAWSASLGADHVGAQQRVPSTTGGQRPGTTEAYSLWNAAATYRQQAGPTQLLWFAKLDNLTNALAYSATSVLTTTVFPKAPLPGRSLKVGLRMAF